MHHHDNLSILKLPMVSYYINTKLDFSHSQNETNWDRIVPSASHYLITLQQIAYASSGCVHHYIFVRKQCSAPWARNRTPPLTAGTAGWSPWRTLAGAPGYEWERWTPTHLPDPSKSPTMTPFCSAVIQRRFDSGWTVQVRLPRIWSRIFTVSFLSKDNSSI